MTNDDAPAVWQDEMALIKIAAAKYGVDSYFIAAIRRAENGRAQAEYDDNGRIVHLSRAFGVLSVHAATYTQQLEVCCRTVAHRLHDFGNATELQDVMLHETPDGSSVQIYTRDFIEWFSRIWAPQGAANDPTGLNANWARNVWYAYLNLIDREHPAGKDEEDRE